VSAPLEQAAFPPTSPLAPSSAEAAEPRREPFTAWSWLLFNLKVGGLTFGMGAITPIYQRALVEDARLLTPEEFQEALTLAQVLPGPSLVSLAMYLGRRVFGTPVAVLGVLCLSLPGAVWAGLVLRWVPFQHPLVRESMRGFAMGALVLLLDFVRRLWPGLTGTHQPGERASTPKLARRIAVSIGLIGLIAARAPMLLVVALGVFTCILAEFAP